MQTHAALRARLTTANAVFVARHAPERYDYVLWCAKHNRQLSPVAESIEEVDTTPSCGACGEERYFIAIQFLSRTEV